jgi:hypothetical protein
LFLNGRFVKILRRTSLVPRDCNNEGRIGSLIHGDVHGINAELFGNEEFDVFFGQVNSLDDNFNVDLDAIGFGNNFSAVFSVGSTKDSSRKDRRFLLRRCCTRLNNRILALVIREAVTDYQGTRSSRNPEHKSDNIRQEERWFPHYRRRQS